MDLLNNSDDVDNAAKDYAFTNSLELMYLINNFTNSIEINNLLIKHKIQRKLDIIKHMIKSGFRVINYDNITSKCILDKLNEIDSNINSNSNSNSNSIFNEELNKILGKILHNIYEYSGYQVLLSNVPVSLWPSSNSSNSSNKIDCESIYDTMIHYIGNKSVIHVAQVSANIYLIHFVNDTLAKECCALLNNNMIGKNIIKVEYIERADIQNADIQKADIQKADIQKADIQKPDITNNIINKIYKIYKYLISFF
jgi:hypothetical protein